MIPQDVGSDIPSHTGPGILLETVVYSTIYPGIVDVVSHPRELRLLFDEPLRLGRIRLLFCEEGEARTQEFVLRWSTDGGRSYQEVVRQQYNFSLPGTTFEVEEYSVELDEVTALELRIVPDINGGGAFASLAQLRLA